MRCSASVLLMAAAIHTPARAQVAASTSPEAAPCISPPWLCSGPECEATTAFTSYRRMAGTSDQWECRGIIISPKYGVILEGIKSADENTKCAGCAAMWGVGGCGLTTGPSVSGDKWKEVLQARDPCDVSRDTDCDGLLNEQDARPFCIDCNATLLDDYRRKEGVGFELFDHSRDLMRQRTEEGRAFLVDEFLLGAGGQAAGDLGTAGAVRRSKDHYVRELGKLVEDVRVLGDDQVKMLSSGYRGAGAVGTASGIGTIASLADKLYRTVDTMRRLEDIHGEAREASARATELLDDALRDFKEATYQIPACLAELDRLRQAEDFLDRAKALKDEWDLGTGLYRDAEGNLWDGRAALQRAKEVLKGLEATETPAAAEETTRATIEAIRASAASVEVGFDRLAERLEAEERYHRVLEGLLEGEREPTEDLSVGC